MLKTVDQALKILMMFNKETPYWRTNELADQLSMNKATVYRMLETLRINDFLVKNEKNKTYHLGVAAWELHLMAYDQLNIKEILMEPLQQLFKQTEESVFFTLRKGIQGITMIVIEPQNKVKFSVETGSRAPLYVGASYHSILAYQKPEIIDRIIKQGLQKYTPLTITDPEVLKKVLADVRENGYAMSKGEYTPDTITLAVPIRSSNKEINSSLTVSGPTYRFDQAKQDKVLPLLFETKKKVEQLISRYEVIF
ncbi:MAG TPA: IclR family transcriptional regulator [Tetragenococcus sp.]|nr:IclR family transcriptional regulator [Tetragenococcus sp.]